MTDRARREILTRAAALAGTSMAGMAVGQTSRSSEALEYLSAIQTADALRSRKFSSLELTDHLIARIERLDAALNAIIARDFDRAREAAKAADAALARGERRALLGVPITVKESFNVAGLPTTWGIPQAKDFKATEDALIVARAKSAGAVILGKTNVPIVLADWQSYNAIHGVTRNPWDLERTPGGSSGGSAAALAAGFGPLSYWFSEGFTDFFARRLMFRAGYGGVEEVARSLNQKLRDYALSPAREASNEAILEGFWTDRDVGKLPYLRGDVIAMLLDAEIRQRSGGTRSLDDFMRDAVERGCRGEKIGTESLLGRIEAWTDAVFAQQVREVVVAGRTAEIGLETFAPCLAVAQAELRAFDAGFDVEASRKQRQVVGVRPGSAAERAGLREGQTLVGWSVSYGKPEVPIELTLREAGVERKIQWLPQGPTILAPQVSVVDGADCSRL